MNIIALLIIFCGSTLQASDATSQSEKINQDQLIQDYNELIARDMRTLLHYNQFPNDPTANDLSKLTENRILSLRQLKYLIQENNNDRSRIECTIQELTNISKEINKTIERAFQE